VDNSEAILSNVPFIPKSFIVNAKKQKFNKEFISSNIKGLNNLESEIHLIDTTAS